MLLRQVAERDIHGTEPPVRGAARGLGMMRQPEHMAELMERFYRDPFNVGIAVPRAHLRPRGRYIGGLETRAPLAVQPAPSLPCCQSSDPEDQRLRTREEGKEPVPIDWELLRGRSEERRVGK